MAVDLGVDPAGLLAAPGEVQEAIVRLLAERSESKASAELREALR